MEDIGKIASIFGQVIRNETAHLWHRGEQAVMLAAKNLACSNRARERIKDLSDVEFQVFSQWGEDGIIDWLISALPSLPEIFVEFGVEDYTEANTRYLLQNRDWRGLVIDGSQENMMRLRCNGRHWMHDLTAVAGFITRDNIDAIITDSGFGGEIGILSIDIDGNDYWVWEAIRSVRPALLICEFNSVFGDIHPVSIPYTPDFERLKGHHSGQYFGASIKALMHLAERKGYTFLGTPSTGVNAFFIRNDYFPYLKDRIENRKVYCARHRNSQDVSGRLTYVGGEKRADLIRDLPVENVVTGAVSEIAALGRIYSKDFISQMRGIPL